MRDEFTQQLLAAFVGEVDRDRFFPGVDLVVQIWQIEVKLAFDWLHAQRIHSLTA